ncbi:MAG: hypothetical protein WCR07_13345 [Verrucomicrobiota bacterium]|jgi:chromosome segregation ATPase
MNGKVFHVAWLAACLGLGAWLYQSKQQAADERKTQAAKADQLSAELVRSEMKLQEQVKVNASLETNLAQRVSELGLVSNKLAFVAQELSRTEGEAKAAMEKARQEIAAREKQIEGLAGEKDDLTRRMQDLTSRIGSLQSQIADTERRLASSEGDREALRKELRRLMAEKASLEQRFNDLAAVRDQLRALREAAYVARRMELIRNGVVGTDRKGAQLLQEGIRKPTPAPVSVPGLDSSLEVEVKASGATQGKGSGKAP